MKPRTVIDITQLANWEGKLTGIPRVMNELGERFNKDESSIFVVWDREGQFFKIIDFESTIKNRHKQINKIEPTPAYHHTNMMYESLKAIKARSRIINKYSTPLIRAYRSKHVSVSINMNNYNPLPKDRMLVMWGDWHDENYIQQLLNIKKQGVCLIHIVHDMLPVITPQFSGHSTDSLTLYANKIYPECDLILANSKNTSRDLSMWLSQKGYKPPKISVIRLGDNFQSTKNFSSQKPKLYSPNLLKNGYILCVGTIEIRKNHMLLYYVYKLASAQKIKLPKLVIVGRLGWKTETTYELMSQDPEVKDNFIFLHDATDEHLKWLYKNCLFSVYPSFYEGWGLPIAESLNYGVPCLCSNTSSMPEVGDNKVDYFSPFSPEECLKVIKRLTNPEYLRQARLRAKTYQPTSWDETYRQVIKEFGELRA